tara:strand:- start:2474 stop:3403 length:930 start_codon:yes stop_codon:yes gene_type:complete
VFSFCGSSKLPKIKFSLEEDFLPYIPLDPSKFEFFCFLIENKRKGPFTHTRTNGPHKRTDHTPREEMAGTYFTQPRPDLSGPWLFPVQGGTRNPLPVMSHKVETPPPGIYDYDHQAQDEMDQVWDFFIDNFGSEEEKSVLNEINQFEKEYIEGGQAWAIFFTEEVSDDMDDWEYLTESSEKKHAMVASSPQGGGSYLCQNDSLSLLWTTDIMWEPRQTKSLDTVEEGKYELDAMNRVVVSAVVRNKGESYENARGPFGPVYINKKYTKYVPGIGKKLKMIIGLNSTLNSNGEKHTHPWRCLKVLSGEHI